MYVEIGLIKNIFNVNNSIYTYRYWLIMAILYNCSIKVCNNRWCKFLLWLYLRACYIPQTHFRLCHLVRMQLYKCHSMCMDHNGYCNLIQQNCILLGDLLTGSSMFVPCVKFCEYKFSEDFGRQINLHGRAFCFCVLVSLSLPELHKGG